MKRLFCLIIGFISLSFAFSQKTETVSASYTYCAPETISVEEAKRVALESAIIEAIATKFSTKVSQHTTSIMSNKYDEFYLYADTEVKGEWIETIGEPKYDITYKDKMLVVTCTVKGKAREIKHQKIPLKVIPLRNGTEMKFASTEFMDGDEFYLSFTSPVDGYLSLWIKASTSDNVYRLLPYSRSNESVYKIDASKNYIFFSSKEASLEDSLIVDEFDLATDQHIEFNELFVLFSPEFYNPPILQNKDHLKLLTQKEFNKWISKVRSNEKIQYTNETLIVKNPTIIK